MNLNQVSVYLSLGSNMGSRKENLKKALGFISERTQLEMLSSVYDTAPVGNENQPRFLNVVCRVSTTLQPVELLAVIKDIEGKLGRLPKTHNLPRPIDIDILFYGDQVISTPDLVIPHPRLHERAFVLIPLIEIAPDLVHPVNKRTVKALLKSVGKNGVVLSGKIGGIKCTK